MVRRMAAASGLIFLLPAILVNLEVGMQAGRSVAALTAAVAMVVGAGVAGMISTKALGERAYSVAALAGIVLLALTCMNVLNALGLASHDRSERRSEAGAAINKVQRLDHRKRTLEDMLRSGSQTLQGPGSATLQADIDAKRLQPFFARSKSCQDVTLPDSRAACGELFALQGRVETMKRLEEARDELGRLTDELNSAASAPESVDAQAENIIAVLSLVVSVPADSTKEVGLFVNSFWAICIELMAGIMPGLVAFAVGTIPPASAPAQPAEVAPERPADPPVKPKAAKSVKKAPLRTDIPASVAAFIDERLAKRAGGSISASELLDAYERFCGDKGLDAVNQRVLGMAMGTAGFAKERSGKVRYTGVALRAERPALAVVGATA